MDNKNLEVMLRIIRDTRRDLAGGADAESKAKAAIIDQMMAQYNADTVGLTVSEVANSLGVCRQSVLEYIKSGLLPARKRKNGRYAIAQADVNRLNRPRRGRPPQNP
jgi:hypothetical protein